MVQKLEAIGISLDEFKWDDGFDHDDVTKIYVRGGANGIRYIYFDYVKSGQLKEGSGHGYLDKSGFLDMFEINHLKNEYLESVEGYYKNPNGIQAIQFKTNFKTSQWMGYVDDDGTKFSLAVKGKKIIGFHGSDGYEGLFSLGAYFSLITANKVKSKGGKGGKEWDDGSNHDNLSKIHVRGGCDGIQFIRFDYVKNGKVINGSIHGVSRSGFTQTFEVNHRNNEYLVSVEGYYDDASGVIQGLQFKTNIKTFDMIGYDKGIKFSLAANGNKIIGFHGYAEKSLNSLGIYFTTHTPNKLDLQGNPKGYFWDDGSSNDGIRKVYVEAGIVVRCIRFEFDNNGKVEKTHFRKKVEDEKEFALYYPDEFITSVEGTVENYSFGEPGWISTLTFKTSKGRTSPTFGKKEDNHTKFVLEKNGNALVGFYGYCDSFLHAIGAYYRPLPPPPNANKIEAKGGDGGALWDDCSFDGVRKIYIGLSQDGVAFLKFMYYKDADVVFGDDHGNKTLCGVQEFELNYPTEYLTSVEGTCDDKSGVITMLRFKTNSQISPDFGVNTTSSVVHVVHKADHKIVGFHGKSSDMLYQLGVHVMPIDRLHK